MGQKQIAGHLMALTCSFVWGSSLVVSKGLLVYLHPFHLMLIRCALAYGALWIIRPKWHFRLREEWRFLTTALFANTLYSWSENTAITLTQTSNVSILVATSPIITVLVLIVFRKEHLTRNQMFGFTIAFVGVVLVVFNGAVTLQMQPAGDLLALLAATFWATYGLLLRRWFNGYDSVLLTRKLMFYGILSVVPLIIANGAPINCAALFSWENAAGFVYQGFMSSALCYILWSSAIQRIGVLKANLYFYMIPLVTLLVSAVVLHETITVIGMAGILLVIAGMILGSLQIKT